MARRLIRPEDVGPSDTAKILGFLNAASSAQEIADGIEIPGEPDIGLRLGQRLLDRRRELGTFTSLQQVAGVPLIGPERFTDIVRALTGLGMEAADVDWYRHQLTALTLRAERAEALARAREMERDSLARTSQLQRQEIDRLRELVENQAAELMTLRERLRDLEAESAEVPLEALLRGFSDAIEEGSKSIEGRTVSSARAEVKAAMRVRRGAAGVSFRSAGTYDAGALSTVSMDLRSIPPTPAEEALAGALQVVVTAVQRLQRALDLDLGVDTSTPAAHAAAFLGDVPPPRDAAERLASLVAALSQLAQDLPVLGEPAGALANRHAAVRAEPTRNELLDVAVALRRVAETLEAAAR
jgi:hypothetical protein